MPSPLVTIKITDDAVGNESCPCETTGPTPDLPGVSDPDLDTWPVQRCVRCEAYLILVPRDWAQTATESLLERFPGSRVS